MAELTKDILKNLTLLSRIKCTEEEEESLFSDLNNILSYVDQLDEIDTEEIQPCDHVLAGMVNVMREDEVCDVMPREVFLSNAPEQIGGLIRVPTVIKGR